jgi:ABC-type bacteriocin/lantibiotic exporter with double-glycine peptidase domain
MNEKSDRMRNIAVIKRLIPFAKPHLKKYMAAGALTIISASTDIVAPLVLLILIDKIIPQKDPLLLAKFGLAFMGLYFLRSLVDFTKGKLLVIFREDVVRSMQRKLYENIQALPVSVFDEEKTGYLASRILADTTTASTLVGETLIVALINLLIAAGTVSIVFIMNWKLTLIAISVVPAFAIGINWFNKYIRDVSHKVQEERSRVYGDIQESLAGIRLIKAFGLEKFRFHEVEKSIDKNRSLNIKLGVFTVLSVAVVLLCTTFAGVLILWYGSYQVIAGTFTLGQLMAFSAYTKPHGNKSEYSNLSRCC